MNSGPLSVRIPESTIPAFHVSLASVRRNFAATFADTWPTTRSEGPPGAGVDGRELPHGPDPLQLADVEAVQADQIPWSGGPQAEPVRLESPRSDEALI